MTFEPTDSYWFPVVPKAWQMVPAWILFDEGTEKCAPDDVHLTPSRIYGVIPQEEYSRRAGHRVVANDQTAANMKKVVPNDFIISMGSYESGIEHSSISGKVSNDYRVLRPTSLVHPGFYRWFLKSKPLIDGLNGLTTEIRVGQRIHYSRFALLDLPLPPLPTQRAIADYLDRETAQIDAMAAELGELIDMLESRRLDTVDHSFQEAQAEHGGTAIGLNFDVHNGDRGTAYPTAKEITEEGVPFINAGDLSNGVVDLSRCKRVSAEKYKSMGGVKLIPGDVLFCLRGSLGKSAIVTFNEGGSLASSLCAVRARPEGQVLPEFLLRGMQSTPFLEQIRFSETGSAQPNLGADQLSRFQVPTPPMAVQRRIVEHLDEVTAEIDSMISDAQALKALLAERRSALITEVVTGRKEVPVP